MLTERYADALQFAWRLHDGQLRKGTSIPYVSHLIAVSSIALEHGANEDEALRRFVSINACACYAMYSGHRGRRDSRQQSARSGRRGCVA